MEKHFLSLKETILTTCPPHRHHPVAGGHHPVAGGHQQLQCGCLSPRSYLYCFQRDHSVGYPLLWAGFGPISGEPSPGSRRVQMMLRTKLGLCKGEHNEFHCSRQKRPARPGTEEPARGHTRHMLSIHH